LIEQLDRNLLEDTGANPAEHVVAAPALEDGRIDTDLVQQLPQQRAGRTGAGDRHLGSHVSSRCMDPSCDSCRPWP